VGLDVGIWLVSHLNGLEPYSWERRLQADGRLFDMPYLFLNARWANQISVLMLWTFLPLLQQLQSGRIRRWRGFWWPLCALVPLLCLLQIATSQGDGAMLATAIGTAMVAVLAWRSGGERRRLYATALLWLLLSAAIAAGLTVLLGGAASLPRWCSATAPNCSRAEPRRRCG
jgi:hypothetical protein